MSSTTSQNQIDLLPSDYAGEAAKNGQAMMYAGGWRKLVDLMQGGLLSQRPRAREGNQRDNLYGQRWPRSSCSLGMSGEASKRGGGAAC